MFHSLTQALRRVAWRFRDRHTPLLIGPWHEEIGTEILYWIPWLHQWRQTHQIAKDRLIIISRGGAGHWYDGGTAIELYDYWPKKDIRLQTYRRTATQQSVKQTLLSRQELALYETVAARLGLTRYGTVHPSVMYHDLRRWFEEREALRTMLGRLRFHPLPIPLLPLSVVVPDRFICVRFYQRHTFELQESVRDWCTQLVTALAKHIPVVVIGSSIHHDDHMDLGFDGPNIVNLTDKFPNGHTLALESAVLAKSQGFVGTYGGTMQLALRLGKPCAGFYLHFRGTAFAHRVLTEWLALQLQVPCFIGTPQQAEFVRQIVSVPLDLPDLPTSSSSGGLV